MIGRVRTTSAVLAALLVASPAAALTIMSAKVEKGAVQVRGKGATPSASITWEGRIVGAASRSGAFRFATAELPADCVGEVGDGSRVAPARVDACTARPGAALVVADANGRVVGPLVVDPGADFMADAAALPSPDGAVLAAFGPAGFLPPSTYALFFESADCTGAPLLPAVAGFVIRARNVVDGLLYYPRPSGSPATLQSSETREPAFGCHSPYVFTPPDRCCCPSPGCMTPIATDAAPPGTIDVGALVPPLRVELR